MPALPRLCLLAGLALLTASCAKKGDPVEGAKAFFALIATGRAEEAYQSASEGFRAQQSEKLFAQTTKELGLANLASLTSAPPVFEDNAAKLALDVTLRDQSKAALIVTMVDERGAWRVFSVRTPKSTQTGLAANLFGAVGKGASFTDKVSQPMPGEEEIRRMVEESLLLFNKSVQVGSFDDFYDGVAQAWQDQLTKGQLKRAFHGFIERQVDIAYIRGKQAIFLEPPAITTEGLLTVQGHFPEEPAYVLFATKFIYETPKWKLFGLDVTLAKPPE